MNTKLVGYVLNDAYILASLDLHYEQYSIGDSLDFFNMYDGCSFE